MPRQTAELKATFRQERIRFENADGDVIVAACENTHGNNITVKVRVDTGEELKHRQSYRFAGYWT